MNESTKVSLVKTCRTEKCFCFGKQHQHPHLIMKGHMRKAVA